MPWLGVPAWLMISGNGGRDLQEPYAARDRAWGHAAEDYRCAADSRRGLLCGCEGLCSLLRRFSIGGQNEAAGAVCSGRRTLNRAIARYYLPGGGNSRHPL